MSYTISVSEDRKYIILKIRGSVTGELAMKQNIEAHTLGNKLGISRYLVDVTEAKNIDSIANVYSFAYEEMQDTPEINKWARVALLVSPKDHSHDFVETVSKNAGLFVTLFRDRELAIQYLLECEIGMQPDHI